MVIEQFSQLLIETKDLETLEKLLKLVNNRIEVVSNASNSEVDGNTDIVHSSEVLQTGMDDFQNLVRLEMFDLSPDLELSLLQELNRLYDPKNFSHNTGKYHWLSSFNIPYSFGGRSVPPESINTFPVLLRIMEQINKQLDCSLDCCLVSRYVDVASGLSPHNDDEPIIDQSHVICNLSIGATRTIQFHQYSNESNGGEQVISYDMLNRSLLLMLPGCQQQLKHTLIPGSKTDGNQLRYCLSFRKQSKPMDYIKPSPIICKSTPRPQFEGMHPSRLATIHKSGSTQSIGGSYKKPSIGHVIVGDSLTRGIDLPDCVTITKGVVRYQRSCHY